MREGAVSSNNDFQKIYRDTNKFLNKAKKENYFSNNEINQRFKENELVLAKKIFFHEFFSKKFVSCIKKAFTYHKPSGLKENLLYYLLNSIK